ncbi:MAG: hypothetical protein M3Y87_11895 [Myxococcota bacterium]|nr:hypothetical protein [Myxococcota bacterium]
MAWTRRLALLSLVTAAALAGCGTAVDPGDSGVVGPVDSSAPIVRCSTVDDPDMDFISGMEEGDGDPDGDGRPNRNDDDSDGDGIPDLAEAGDRDCTTPAVDTDHDGIPDYLDLDSNGDGLLDADQRESDVDGDGTPDWRDADVDGDGIQNVDELGEDGSLIDTDADGTPDVRDLDSDGDTILDAIEGNVDRDRDGTPNFRDLDADGDGVEDAIEAGDGVLETPPRSCENEVDPLTGERDPDGLADFVDFDSDNDGLGDGEEADLGTDPCNIDSDGDGVDDLAEGAYERFNCPDGTTGEDCGCATSASCQIPSQHYYVVLPYQGPAVERDLDFGTTIRIADVFFITDTTGSMGGTLTNVKATVATSGTGLIARIGETIPDAWVGGGQHDDFPFGSYGGSPDEPLILAIRMTPPERSADVSAAFNAIMLHGGGDGPESQTEAIYQTMTGEGGTWMGPAGWGGGAGGMYTMHRYVGDCLDSGWGAPCFRDSALPIIVLFTDICSHNGPPDDDTAACDDYAAITPAPATWTDTIAEMNRRGAKFIGVNASGGASCSTVTAPGGYSPCWYLKRTAEETGSVDLDGNALVYDLPNSASISEFTETVVGAIETVATRVPLDVDTGLRDDVSDPQMVNATRFIKRRQPACNVEGIDTCWVPPTGIEHAQAVAAYDTSTFFGVVPGTRVTFRITFQNDFYPGGPTAELFIAFIDVRGGGASVLDTRQVFVVVPANDDFLPG